LPAAVATGLGKDGIMGFHRRSPLANTAWQVHAAALLATLLALAPLPGGTGTAWAATWFADAAQPDDSGDGLSWGTAKQTIGAAIAASAASDTILVKYGLYPVGEALVISSNRCLGSDDGTHTGWDAALPDSSQCIVSADATCRVMTITSTAVTATTIVRGFTLTGGDATSEGDPNYGYGGGLDISGGADPIVERCRMTANLAGHTFNGNGGGISVRGTGTVAEIRHCRIDNNTGSSAWYAYGGGVYVASSGYAAIHDCAIVGNRGSTARVGGGGGVAYYGGSGELRDCEIVSNIASTLSAGVGGSGGGLYCYASTVVVQECAITGNIAAEASGGQGSGGGVCLINGTGVQILDCTIAGNLSSVRGNGTGGGIRTGSGATIRGDWIEDNCASTATSTSYSGSGGGLYLADSNTDCRENVIIGNTACVHGVGYGGGIAYESTNTIERNVVRGNVASTADDGYGGGIYTGGGYRTSLRNNTVVGNANTLDPTAGGAGSGIYLGSSAASYVENNIVCDHDIAGSDGVGAYAAIAFTIGYNAFHGNAVGNTNPLIVSQHEQLGDPCFTDPAAGDFTLRYDSPCIEGGNPAAPVPANGGWRVDIGAFEYTGTRHWRAIAGAGEYLFGGRVKAKVNLTDPGTLSAIDMFVHPGEQHPLAPNGVQRYYTIDPTGEVVLFDLTLSYLEEELNGADEDSLGLWRWGGASWEGPKHPIAADQTANWLMIGGETAFSDWMIAEFGAFVGTPESPAPAALTLAPNYPNPFNPRTRLEYRLPAAAHARLAVYDGAGRLVRVLADGEREAGEHQVSWDGRAADGRELPSGIYLCELRAGGERQVRKLVLAR
jgi:hypothetical protein